MHGAGLRSYTVETNAFYRKIRLHVSLFTDCNFKKVSLILFPEMWDCAEKTVTIS
jgi:hypothetical protein